ncbi:helix-turn-helix domain-containing protein [Gracilibacillus alcaliphilus]|uniref:helix-turn-helix domain-containing protein n=1 Tax=Gracilibacillus alcaliphilus TaxID=1401441 RepID=UPI0019570B6D|nr:helix-turn-helix transcriptional regulator [Gracilibacillus alcaliphilus]MBM7676584.1 AraC-like DNA-binding protein [Gracilibacillus alcaliphilus]
MYNPKGNGKQKTISQVQFIEVEPPSHLSGLVHRFLELKTDTPLADDYLFHALPDSCTYLIFDQLNPEITGITKLHATSEELNLGKEFHYVNIRFLPGVWKGSAIYGIVDSPYTGLLPLDETNRRLAGLDFTAKQSVLSDLVEQLIEEKLVAANPVTEKIFAQIDDIHMVADMAGIAGVSTRQLQRTLRQTTGFAPHDFLKVLRLQQSLDSDSYLSYYADQSHFIRSFRKATGYTPANYTKKFDV